MSVRRVAGTRLPTRYGVLRAIGYEDTGNGTEHVALVAGDPGDGALVRVHSECLTGEAFGSRTCDCGSQLDAALQRIAADGGVVVYLRGHEGRGIGLLRKLRAYELQERGLDTVEANLALGLPVDARDFSAAADILRDLGIERIRLLTNNPDKAAQLERHGVEVLGLVPLLVGGTPENARYLATKAERMGHLIPG